MWQKQTSTSTSCFPPLDPFPLHLCSAAARHYHHKAREDMHGFIHKIISQCKRRWNLWRSEKEGGLEGENLPPGATTKWKQQSQPKACSVKQQCPEQRRCCVFSTTSVLYGGPDLSQGWPQPVREEAVCWEMTHYTSRVGPQSCCQSGNRQSKTRSIFLRLETEIFSLSDRSCGGFCL